MSAGSASGSGPPLRVVVASANPDKVAEIKEILAGVLSGGIDLVDRPAGVEEVDETGATFEENARLKALALVRATGLPAVADDSGLEVDALGGAPGVRSARYAGPGASYADNVAKLLGALAGAIRRGARFRTVALMAFPDGTELVAEGTVEGTVVPVARGSGGFGYDPVFLPAEEEGGNGRTFGEIPPTEKHQLSARGRAFRALGAQLAGRR